MTPFFFSFFLPSSDVHTFRVVFSPPLENEIPLLFCTEDKHQPILNDPPCALQGFSVQLRTIYVLNFIASSFFAALFVDPSNIEDKKGLCFLPASIVRPQ